jgi:hypothetical protein
LLVPDEPPLPPAFVPPVFVPPVFVPLVFVPPVLVPAEPLPAAPLLPAEPPLPPPLGVDESSSSPQAIDMALAATSTNARFTIFLFIASSDLRR